MLTDRRTDRQTDRRRMTGDQNSSLELPAEVAKKELIPTSKFESHFHDDQLFCVI